MGDRHVPSRVLSNGPDIRPDLNISPDEYVKEEAFQKWMKANDTVLRARTRQSFIAGAICGIFVLVSIIMAGVSLGKIAENGGRLDDQKVKLTNLESELTTKVDLDKKLELRALKTELSEQKDQITRDYKAYADCKSSHHHTTGGGVTGTNTCP